MAKTIAKSTTFYVSDFIQQTTYKSFNTANYFVISLSLLETKLNLSLFDTKPSDKFEYCISSRTFKNKGSHASLEQIP